MGGFAARVELRLERAAQQLAGHVSRAAWDRLRLLADDADDLPGPLAVAAGVGLRLTDRGGLVPPPTTEEREEPPKHATKGRRKPGRRLERVSRGRARRPRPGRARARRGGRARARGFASPRGPRRGRRGPAHRRRRAGRRSSGTPPAGRCTRDRAGRAACRTWIFAPAAGAWLHPAGGFVEGQAGARAARTSSACVSGFTSCMTLATVPSAAMRNVVRLTPMYVRPA